MEKAEADRMIKEYLPKIYGFAMKKAFSYDEAEDLAGEIVQEVYLSFLKTEEIVNLEGYVWRISSHVYGKYVAVKKRHQGLAIDGMEIPFYEDYDALLEPVGEECAKLRREIAFLTEKRREIVFLFYYENLTVARIAQMLNIPEGTVKWHLNKARHELKEGFSMERKIGTLGLAPVKATETGFGHNGMPDPDNRATGFYLGDRLSLNIVYSVYQEPRTLEEIAVELGITPVFIEDKVNYLEENGFLVRRPGGRFTTYVLFSPRTRSREQVDQELRVQKENARILAEEYVPLVRKAMEDVTEVYIPGGNRELLEAAACFYGICCKSSVAVHKDLSNYFIKTLAGGNFIAEVDIGELSDPEYQCEFDGKDYWACGSMNRSSGKYPGVSSWSVDTKYCSRQGLWKNNLTSDYDYLYEFMKGMLTETTDSEEKLQRLRERGYLTEDGKVNVMIVKGSEQAFFDRIPAIGEELKKGFADRALESAMMKAKNYPSRMQELVIFQETANFISNIAAVMTMEYLYARGIFRPLTERERVTANLLMFSDVLPCM